MPHPIPQGQPTITPYLVVKGAEKAIEFYKTAFGAEELVRMPWPGSDGQMRIGHAELKIGDSILFLTDESPECGALAPAGRPPISIHLYVTDVDKAFAQAVEAGAQTMMPPTDMFWGDRFGQLTDPFGHLWSMAEHIEDVSPEEMKERMAAMFAGAEAGAAA